MKKFLIRTLGCKVNQYDSQALRDCLAAHGWQESEREPDVVIVNTCTVTGTSDEKCRKLIRKLHRLHPEARIIATGCYAERDAQALFQIDGVSEVIPGRRKHELLNLANEDAASGFAGRFFAGVQALSGHSRAFIKVQDGCENFCSYCVVPFVRGPVQSRNPGEALDEARRLIDSGFKEIVLTGIHLGHYGKDSGKEALPDLVETLSLIPGRWRLRLSSIEVAEVTPRLLDVMASSERVCPHLHVPLQSGDDRILQMMNRRYSRADYLNAVERIRRKLANPGLTTDVLVGFPGEGEAEFRNTQALCREVGFSRLHVFPFSPREGTRAFDLPNRVPADEARRRVGELCLLDKELRRSFAQKFAGTELDVLVEARTQKKTSMLTGYSERYVRAILKGPEELKGTLIRARGIQVQPGGDLLAEAIDRGT